MAQITAALVKQLRDRTQLPMMDCKRALSEADGDIENAEDALRKAGALAAANKAGRETAEGRIGIYVSDCRSCAAVVEIQCETAPVANTESFIELCDKIAEHVATTDAYPENVEALLTQTVASAGKTVTDMINDVINQIRENMQIARFAKLQGSTIASYQHHNGQVASLVRLDVEGGVADDKLIAFGRDICMHITAINPMALDRDGIPADLAEKEAEIIKEQTAAQAKNKPPEIVEKIVTGKLNKWFNERVLLEQPYVKEDKLSVQKVLDQFGKDNGKTTNIAAYLRFEVGGLS